jgi:inositol phosphorylceramide synthase catalytic subunit
VTLAARLRSTPRPLLLTTVLVFTLYLTGAAMTYGTRVEQVLGCSLLLVACVWNERSRQAFLGLVPFVALGIVYDVMRLLRPLIAHAYIRVIEPYRLEQRLFSFPGVHPLTLNEYFSIHHNATADFFTGLAYIFYVFAPLGFALYLAAFRQDPKGRTLLRHFGWTFCLMNLAGFITYFVYPAAPPWYVTAHGFGPADVATPASAAAAGRWDALTGIPYFKTIYSRSSNVFGAIPSLHVAYPLLTFLYARALRRPGLDLSLFALYLLVCFAAVYLQHHYLLDVVLGTGYALAGYAVDRISDRRARLARIGSLSGEP